MHDEHVRLPRLIHIGEFLGEQSSGFIGHLRGNGAHGLLLPFLVYERYLLLRIYIKKPAEGLVHADQVPVCVTYDEREGDVLQEDGKLYPHVFKARHVLTYARCPPDTPEFVIYGSLERGKLPHTLGCLHRLLEGSGLSRRYDLILRVLTYPFGSRRDIPYVTMPLPRHIFPGLLDGLTESIVYDHVLPVHVLKPYHGG